MSTSSRTGVTRASFLGKSRIVLLGLVGVPAAAAAPGAPPSADEMLKRGFDGFSGKTLEQKVQELADREEIRELTARYAQRVSRRISPADLFTDDGAFIVHTPNSPVQESRGRKELDERFAAIVARPDPSLPKIHNHVISISGNEAMGLCWIEVHTKGQPGGGEGYYEDRFRRVNGRWKFVVRDATMVEFQTGGTLPPLPVK